MPRLIWVFARRTLIMLVLSCRGSYMRWHGTHRAPVVAICEGNSMRLTLQRHVTCFSLENKQRLWPLVGGAHPYIPNMLQNSCRNRLVSYTVARWSYYVALIHFLCRSISYYIVQTQDWSCKTLINSYKHEVISNNIEGISYGCRRTRTNVAETRIRS